MIVPPHNLSAKPMPALWQYFLRLLSARLGGRDHRTSAAWIPLSTVVAGRDLVGRSHAAYVSGTKDALPAHAPAAELVGDRIATTTPQAAHWQVAPGCA